MIFVPAPEAELRYRPSYVEIADDNIYQRYLDTSCLLLNSRDASQYLRLKIAGFEADHRLQQISNVKPNWDTYGGDAPTSDSIRNAKAIIGKAIVQGLLPSAILPSAEGGVAVCFATQLKYADIECLNSGEILAVHYGRDEEPHAWVVGQDENDAEITIRTISEFLAA